MNHRRLRRRGATVARAGLGVALATMLADPTVLPEHALAAVVPGPPQSYEATEASGVVRDNDRLLIVDDGVPGIVLAHPLPAERFSPIDPTVLVADAFPDRRLMLDLEGIDILADGRVVVLSERLRMLIAADGIVAEYDDLLAEVGERGLEGVAVRPLADGSSRVAVLWEGGYLRSKELLPGLRMRGDHVLLADRSVPPVVFTHRVPLAVDPAQSGSLPIRAKEDTTARYLTLQVPQPPGEEPGAQRFRAPDLVWHKMGEEWGFIVLLNSSSADPRRFAHLWLLRFDGEGRPVGDPVDLDEAIPGGQDLNWEGLAWLEPGRSLVLVDDTSGRRADGPGNVAIVMLKPDW